MGVGLKHGKTSSIIYEIKSTLVFGETSSSEIYSQQVSLPLIDAKNGTFFSIGIPSKTNGSEV